MISIIMPVYNCENYIKESIESVLAQSFSDFELIAVDDGSSDDSAKIIKAYAEKDTRIKYFHKENGGVSSARNLGIEKARADYIMFLDADDCFAGNALATVAEICANQAPDLIVHPALRFVKDTNITSPFNSPIFDDAHLLCGESDKKEHLYPAFFKPKHNIGCTCSWVIKRDLLASLRFDTNMIIYEDMLFALNLCKKAKTCFCMPDAIYLYRNNPTGCVNTFNYKKLDNLKSSSRFIETFAQKNGIILPENYIFFRTFSALMMSCMPIIKNQKLFNDFYSFIRADNEFSAAINWAISNKHPKAKYVSPCALKRDFARTWYLLKVFLKKLLKRRH